MPLSRRQRSVAGIAFGMCLAAGYIVTQLPRLGAGGLLYPARRAMTGPAPAGCRDTMFAGDEVTLAGWNCAAIGPRRGSLVYLHGIADNRAGSTGVIARFTRQGFNVVAYDSRAHGRSGGAACTYGFYEKQDLRRVIDTLAAGPVVLIGQSLGAAVSLQEAADDSRVTAIVAAETFSSLREVVNDRAPFFFTRGIIDRGFALAEREAMFRVDDVNPAAAAARISIPVLLIHGSADTDTPPAHSQRVYASLAGRKRLILVPGAHHNESMRGGDVWTEIDRWIAQVIEPG